MGTTYLMPTSINDPTDPTGIVDASVNNGEPVYLPGHIEYQPIGVIGGSVTVSGGGVKWVPPMVRYPDVTDAVTWFITRNGIARSLLSVNGTPGDENTIQFQSKMWRPRPADYVRVPNIAWAYGPSTTPVGASPTLDAFYEMDYGLSIGFATPRPAIYEYTYNEDGTVASSVLLWPAIPAHAWKDLVVDLNGATIGSANNVYTQTPVSYMRCDITAGDTTIRNIQPVEPIWRLPGIEKDLLGYNDVTLDPEEWGYWVGGQAFSTLDEVAFRGTFVGDSKVISNLEKYTAATKTWSPLTPDAQWVGRSVNGWYPTSPTTADTKVFPSFPQTNFNGYCSTGAKTATYKSGFYKPKVTWERRDIGGYVPNGSTADADRIFPVGCSVTVPGPSTSVINISHFPLKTVLSSSPAQMWLEAEIPNIAAVDSGARTITMLNKARSAYITPGQTYTQAGFTIPSANPIGSAQYVTSVDPTLAELTLSKPAKLTVTDAILRIPGDLIEPRRKNNFRLVQYGGPGSEPYLAFTGDGEAGTNTITSLSFRGGTSLPPDEDLIGRELRLTLDGSEYDDPLPPGTMVTDVTTVSGVTTLTLSANLLDPVLRQQVTFSGTFTSGATSMVVPSGTPVTASWVGRYVIADSTTATPITATPAKVISVSGQTVTLDQPFAYTGTKITLRCPILIIESAGEPFTRLTERVTIRNGTLKMGNVNEIDSAYSEREGWHANAFGSCRDITLEDLEVLNAWGDAFFCNDSNDNNFQIGYMADTVTLRRVHSNGAGRHSFTLQGNTCFRVEDCEIENASRLFGDIESFTGAKSLDTVFIDSRLDSGDNDWFQPKPKIDKIFSVPRWLYGASVTAGSPIVKATNPLSLFLSGGKGYDNDLGAEIFCTGSASATFAPMTYIKRIIDLTHVELSDVALASHASVDAIIRDPMPIRGYTLDNCVLVSGQPNYFGHRYGRVDKLIEFTGDLSADTTVDPTYGVPANQIIRNVTVSTRIDGSTPALTDTGWLLSSLYWLTAGYFPTVSAATSPRPRVLRVDAVNNVIVVDVGALKENTAYQMFADGFDPGRASHFTVKDCQSWSHKDANGVTVDGDHIAVFTVPRFWDKVEITGNNIPADPTYNPTKRFGGYWDTWRFSGAFTAGASVITNVANMPGAEWVGENIAATQPNGTSMFSGVTTIVSRNVGASAITVSRPALATSERRGVSMSAARFEVPSFATDWTEDSNYFPSADDNDVTPTYATTTVLAVDTNPGNVGEARTFTVTVTPTGGGPAPEGEVTLGRTTNVHDAWPNYMGRATLVGGVATFTTPATKADLTGPYWSAGTYYVVAKYNGTHEWGYSRSSKLTLVIGTPPPKETPALTVEATPLTVVTGAPVTISGQVDSLTPATGGTVTFLVDGIEAQTVSLDVGAQTGYWVTVFPAAGTYTLTATYSGDVTHEAVTSTNSFDLVVTDPVAPVDPRWSIGYIIF